MSDRLLQKVSGLVVARLGSNMTPPRRAEEDAQAVSNLLEEYPIGGILLFNGRWPETRETLKLLQSKSDRDLLVMTDMERGLGQQIAGATLFPHLAAFGSLGEEAGSAVREFARAGAREALAAGVHVALAPIADVNCNPLNPIISTRAFGADTKQASQLVAAYVEAASAEGLLTTAKHFPGHGNTSEDSHETTPVVDDSRDVIEDRDLPPFQAAIDAGVDLIMTAHVRYPALDESGAIATRSHAILMDLLKHRMNFNGVVITDSLHMAGAREDSTEVDAAVELLNAGVDMLLDLRDPEAVIEGVV
ncbi:MAG: glycoside hydrolase family 3 N-terminal domain-containing protein, partial [Rubricoccaceae bacterium]|nr:glycoside hydrolase family 3 N-terminal domain-containing protein [Rubricoccaceae bacterium]